MKQVLNVLFAAVFFVFASINASANSLATTASVYFSADAESWVGGAVGSPTATWIHGVDGVFSGGTNGNLVQINYNNGSYWTFNFAAPQYDPVTNTLNGQILHSGLYMDAARYPFNSPTRPGMSIYGNGRGDNTSFGWFDILEFGYDANTGSITKFAVDFKQFDETSVSSGPGLYGSLRYNSLLPLDPVPEPNTYAMMVTGLLIVGALAVRHRRA